MLCLFYNKSGEMCGDKLYYTVFHRTSLASYYSWTPLSYLSILILTSSSLNHNVAFSTGENIWKRTHTYIPVLPEVLDCWLGPKEKNRFKIVMKRYCKFHNYTNPYTQSKHPTNLPLGGFAGLILALWLEFNSIPQGFLFCFKHTQHSRL